MNLRKMLGAKGYKTVKNGIWCDHPIFTMCLGICSTLAVTNRVDNAIAMGAGVTFVLIATALFIAPLRKWVPTRVRIITYMIIISSFVIIVDRFLKAFFPDISEAIGPYVGLIITNCIIMGRAEAFYIQNNLYHSLLDSLSNGISFTYTIVIIAIIRELLGFGSLMGIQVMPDCWENWVVMTMAPGAFFLLGIAIWISNWLNQRGMAEEEAV